MRVAASTAREPVAHPLRKVAGAPRLGPQPHQPAQAPEVDEQDARVGLGADRGKEQPRDRVEVGQKISLPAIPARVRPLNTPVWWIKIDDRDSLESAFNLLRKHLNSSAAVRLIPYWNPSEGTRFALLLEKLFTDEVTRFVYFSTLKLFKAMETIVAVKLISQCRCPVPKRRTQPARCI